MMDTLSHVIDPLSAAIDARKCHSCGCFHQTVAALAQTHPGRTLLSDALNRAEQAFLPAKYDCLGCEVCFPAVAANAFGEAFPDEAAPVEICPTAAPATRAGWPPLPGDYVVVRYAAPVAVCTLGSAELMTALGRAGIEGLSIVGTLSTENLGIERLVQNVVANPNLRRLLLCGDEPREAVGHLPGQALRCLLEHGVDEHQSIVGARGKRPVLRNLSAQTIAAFRRQIELVDRVGETNVEALAAAVQRAAESSPPPLDVPNDALGFERVRARPPARLVPDPAGYLVVYPDRRARVLSVEHFDVRGVLSCVVEGETAVAVYSELIARGLVTRLDHAAYLGRELARAEQALASGERYVQDRAPGDEVRADDAPAACACCAGKC